MLPEGQCAIIEYRDFYDMPRAMLVQDDAGRRFFFDCPFDEEADEYPDVFVVYLVSEPAWPASIPGPDWERVGSVACRDLRMDPTRRQSFSLP